MRHARIIAEVSKAQSVSRVAPDRRWNEKTDLVAHCGDGVRLVVVVDPISTDRVVSESWEDNSEARIADHTKAEVM